MARSLVQTDADTNTLAFSSLPRLNTLFIWSEGVDEGSVARLLQSAGEQFQIPVLYASWRTTTGIEVLSNTAAYRRVAVHREYVAELGSHIDARPTLLVGVPWPFAVRAGLRLLLTTNKDVLTLSPVARRLCSENNTLHLYRDSLAIGKAAIHSWCQTQKR